MRTFDIVCLSIVATVIIAKLLFELIKSMRHE